MRFNRIFCPELPANGVAFELPEKQANYVGGVLRLRTNDAISVFNGKGDEYIARIISVGRKQVTLELGEMVNNTRESPLTVELGQVISRGDRMDYAIQKSVELGVSAISPLFSERCEVKLDPRRLAKRSLHWQQIVYSACEQCGRSLTPTVNQPQYLAEWLATAAADLKIIFHPHHQQKDGSNLLLPNGEIPERIAILIGPEGGFSDQEVVLSEQNGFTSLTLGPRVLRTETAPVVALSFVQQRWGDLQLR